MSGAVVTRCWANHKRSRLCFSPHGRAIWSHKGQRGLGRIRPFSSHRLASKCTAGSGGFHVSTQRVLDFPFHVKHRQSGSIMILLWISSNAWVRTSIPTKQRLASTGLPVGERPSRVAATFVSFPADSSCAMVDPPCLPFDGTGLKQPWPPRFLYESFAFSSARASAE